MKQFLNFTLLMLALLLLPGFVIGQKTITGVITDASDGEPLIGANILVVGASSGTITDFDGSFSVEVPEGYNKLAISYTGYASIEVELDGSNTLNIALEPGEVLDEVVVIGYGTVKREDATGSVQTVDTKRFNQGAITSPQELIAGKVAGVQISTGGDPGGGSTIRIRGGSSLSATNDPLIIIDGVPVSNGNISGGRNPLNIVNPNDIETFTVLKDASATAIYGSRASNGVIIITTKKGALGRKISVGYQGSVAFSTRADEADNLNGDEFRALVNNQFDEGHPARDLLGNENTDWQDEIFQTGITHDHNLNLSGGIGVVPYRVSLGYTNRTGILKTGEFDRQTVAVNLSPGFFENRLQVNVNFKGLREDNRFADWGAIGGAVGFDPTKPVRVGENQFGGYYTWLQSDGSPNTVATTNPLALLEQKTNVSEVYRYILNTQVDYRFGFLPELRANLNLGYDYSKGEGTIDIPENAAFAFSDGGRDEEYTQENKNELLEFYLNYVKEFGQFNLDVMGGYSWQRFFIEDYSFAQNVAGTEILDPADRSPREYFLVSLFGRMNISFADQLLLTFTLRQDGTSRFSEDNRYGIFPAAALAWKAYSNVESSGLSSLKLRVGYGVTGQQEVGGFYNSIPRYLFSQPNARYQIGNEFISTIRPEGYNANLKWEETTTYNFAVDYGFWQDRINGAIEVYYRKTNDLLNFIPVPAGSNLTNQIDDNVGDLENRGIEFSINAIPYQTNKASWDIGLNVTYNENEITRLIATDDPDYLGVFTGGIAGGVGNTIQIHSVGHPANSFFVYEQVYDDNGVPIEGLYVDRNGDGQVTPEDRYRLEDPAPDVFLGFSSRFEYDNFDIAFAGRANFGNYVYNNNLSNQGNYNRIYTSTGSGTLNNVHPETAAIDFTVAQFFSDHYIQNASFLRLDFVTLGYNFQNLFEKNIRLRLYGTVQNPFIITDYDGIDPEVIGGIDNNIYPRSRTFLFGVNANF